MVLISSAKVTFVIKLSVNFQLSSGNGSGGEEVKRPLCSGSAIQPSSPLIKEIHRKICFSVWISREGQKQSRKWIYWPYTFFNMISEVIKNVVPLFIGTVRIQSFMSERCAEMVKLIVCSLREFEQNCTYLHPTLAFITVKESAWEGQVQNMFFFIFAKKWG